MRKWLIAAGVVGALVVAVLVLRGGDDEDAYMVRAIFDNGGFMVPGEEVRVAGATVGSIESVTVTMPGEVDSYEDGKPQSLSGKAAIVLKIDDPGFQDFRQDATCLIRPQSLIGEKFIDCRPTLPRAPGSKPPPPLREIPDGETGAGEYLLPVENNSTSVDPDLINNIGKLPYAQRFRIILNELGATLAGRGEDLEEVVKRANPALRDVTHLISILNDQRDQLAQLSADSQEILEPLARERSSVAGFLTNSGAAAEASAEEGEALEASLSKFPEFLRELRHTMRSLEGFSEAGTPVLADLGKAAPALTRATEALAPFAAASTVSLKSLGETGEAAGPKLRAADPVVRKATEVALTGAGPTTKLAEFFGSTTEEEGFANLVKLIYNSAATTNEFDQYGHFGRAITGVVNAIDYSKEQQSGAVGQFNGPKARASASAFDAASASALMRLYREAQELQGGETGGTSSELGPVKPRATPPAPATPAPAPAEPELGESEQLGVKASPSGPQRALLDYLLSP